MKSLAKMEWVLRRFSKSYLNNQWLWCLELIWFNKTNILHAIIFYTKRDRFAQWMFDFTLSG
jgi:hypothetical protein